MAWFDSDYLIILIQQSQDKKNLLTHDHRRHRREEAANEHPEGWHGHAAGGTGRANSRT